jgi:hypothetical protein
VIAAVFFAAHVQRVTALHDDEQREGSEENERDGDFHGTDLPEAVNDEIFNKRPASSRLQAFQ